MADSFVHRGTAPCLCGMLGLSKQPGRCLPDLCHAAGRRLARGEVWCRIQFAAISAGFSRNVAAQLVGAIGEMQSNIYEHSHAPQTGIVAFRGRSGTFEFVVCDSGIGVLQSLTSCPEFQGITNYGEALHLTLSDGVRTTGATAEAAWAFSLCLRDLPTLTAFFGFDPVTMP
jgi:hypothetical protein